MYTSYKYSDLVDANITISELRQYGAEHNLYDRDELDALDYVIYLLDNLMSVYKKQDTIIDVKIKQFSKTDGQLYKDYPYLKEFERHCIKSVYYHGLTSSNNCVAEDNSYEPNVLVATTSRKNFDLMLRNTMARRVKEVEHNRYEVELL